jgi:hypothetical protein
MLRIILHNYLIFAPYDFGKFTKVYTKHCPFIVVMLPYVVDVGL